MTRADDIAKTIREFLNREDWKFHFDEEEKVFSFGLRLDCKLKTADYRIVVRDEHFWLSAVCPLPAWDVLPQMAEFICRANYALLDGKFELDFRDGEIRYTIYVNTREHLPSVETVERAVYLTANMLERYGDGITAVLFSEMTPAEAIAACEKPEPAEGEPLVDDTGHGVVH